MTYNLKNFDTFNRAEDGDTTANLATCLNVTKVLFRCENFLDFATVALSFVCGKYCPIID